MKRRALRGLRLAYVALLATCWMTTTATADSSATASKCASLTGAWSGAFEGSATGTWIARFRQTGDTMSATARILVVGAGGLEGAGTARLTCKDGVVSLDGDGHAGRHQGTFSGYAHRDGNFLVGNWAAGSMSGTWNGERARRDPGPGVLPDVP